MTHKSGLMIALTTIGDKIQSWIRIVIALIAIVVMFASFGDYAFAQTPCFPGVPCKPPVTDIPGHPGNKSGMKPEPSDNVAALQFLSGRIGTIERVQQLHPKAIRQLQQEDPQVIQKLQQGDVATVQKLQQLAPSLIQQLK